MRRPGIGDRRGDEHHRRQPDVVQLPHRVPGRREPPDDEQHQLDRRSGRDGERGDLGAVGQGAVGLYNESGTIDLLIDVVGYFVPTGSGLPGTTGPAGSDGATGANTAGTDRTERRSRRGWGGWGGWCGWRGRDGRRGRRDGTDGADAAAATSGYSATQIATLAWYEAAHIELPAGAGGPSGVAFDGRYVWTTNQNTNNVTRIDPATGAGTNFALSANLPMSIAFDGTSMWATGFFSNTVSRIDPATGVETVYALPGGANRPFAIAFDGTNCGPPTTSRTAWPASIRTQASERTSHFQSARGSPSRSRSMARTSGPRTTTRTT